MDEYYFLLVPSYDKDEDGGVVLATKHAGEMISVYMPIVFYLQDKCPCIVIDML